MSSKFRPVVYVASPYTKGDPAINTHFQCKIFDRLMTDGIVWPVVPLWSHFQHSIFPRRYQDWIDYDLALLERYDACLRLNASLPELAYYVSESSGADGEVAAFERMGKPVFRTIEQCYEWARNYTMTAKQVEEACKELVAKMDTQSKNPPECQHEYRGSEWVKYQGGYAVEQVCLHCGNRDYSHKIAVM